MNKNDVEMSPESTESSAISHSEERGSPAGEQRRKELADFLRTRREKIKPEQVGIVQGARRRTPGLRREEVAELAGVGTTWYTWLEQARDIQPSSEVLRRLGQALQLNPAELRHIFALAGKAAPLDFEGTAEVVTESQLRILKDALQVPALLVGARWDILAVNDKANELFPQLSALTGVDRNWLTFVFRNEDLRRDTANWEAAARRVLAEFRSSLSESLDNPWVLEVVDRLKAESPEFTKWWREHDVRENTAVTFELTHPKSGVIAYERMILKPWENMRYKILLWTPVK